MLYRKINDHSMSNEEYIFKFFSNNFYSIKIAGLKGRACLAFPFGS